MTTQMDEPAAKPLPNQGPDKKAAAPQLLRRQGWGLGYAAPPDGGYGWVVVAASFFLQVVSLGVALSAGVVFIELLDAFQEGKGITALTGSVTTGLLFGTGPFSTVLTYRFGFRVTVTCGALLATVGCIISAFATSIYVLVISNGIILGLGFGLVYVPSVVIVGYYFSTRRPLAVALASSGVGAGTLAMPPILRYLIRLFGWRGAYMISAGICLNMCVASSLLLPVSVQKEETDNPKEGSMENSSSDQSNREMKRRVKIFDLSQLKDFRQWILVLCNLMWNIGALIFLTLLPDYAKTQGVSKDNVPWLVSMFGLTNCFAKIATGFVPNTPRFDRLLMFSLSTIVGGCCIFMVLLKPFFATLMVYAALYGAFVGIQVAVGPVVLTRIFGVQKLNSAFGLLMIGDGLGALVGPPAAGWIYDWTRKFYLSFVFAGVVTLLSAGKLFALFVYQRRREIAKESIKEEPVHQSQTNPDVPVVSKGIT